MKLKFAAAVFAAVTCCLSNPVNPPSTASGKPEGCEVVTTLRE